MRSVPFRGEMTVTTSFSGAMATPSRLSALRQISLDGARGDLVWGLSSGSLDFPDILLPYNLCLGIVFMQGKTLQGKAGSVGGDERGSEKARLGFAEQAKEGYLRLKGGRKML